MKVSFLGHATVKLDDLAIDVWTKPLGPGFEPPHTYTAADKQFKTLCITHNHADHRLGAEEILSENKATVVAGFELASEFAEKGFAVSPMNVGGQIECNGWKIHMTPAWHSASSNPSGFVLQKNGLTVYHAGDTALFSDIKLIAEQFKIDLAFLPIGDRFTMGINDAVTAAKWLKPKTVVPIHYNTFDMIRVDEHDFEHKIKTSGLECKLLKPGQSIEL